MMRSLYSGVSGLKTHQVKMDVIGNNIANVNTTAFKSSSVTFSELMTQTTQKASGPDATSGKGGTNARQIGLGVKSGAINTNISTQGASQSTGNPFDIMITGSNFFVVSDGNENFFTRNGSFYIDGGGNLAMTSTGYNVMGWGVDEDTGFIKKDTVSALRIMSEANTTFPPEATTKGFLSGIMDKNDSDVKGSAGKSVNLNFYDNLGYGYTAKLNFKQSSVPGEYSIEIEKLLDSKGNKIDISPMKENMTKRGQMRDTKLSFDYSAYEWDGNQLKTTGENGKVLADITNLFENDGNGNSVLRPDDAVNVTVNGVDITVKEALESLAKAYGKEGNVEEFLALSQSREVTTVVNGETVTTTEYDTIEDMLKNPASFPKHSSNNPTWELDSRVYYGDKVSFDNSTGKFFGINGSEVLKDIRLNLSELGGNFEDITVDLSEMSMFDNKGTSTIGATSGDFDGVGAGRRIGNMIGVTVQDNGMIYSTYDNGMTKLIGQIATAEFANASGLEKKGDNLYSATLNSGSFDGIGVEITGNGGYMSTGQLEMSNVDLSMEFTEMITTQRGFQANSRIITVSDTLLEELTNLKR